MKNRYSLPAAAALAVILAGCAPAPPPPAPDTRAADAQAIRDLEKAWEQAFATKDVDKIGAFYADDASALLSNMPVINGVPAIKATLKAMVEDKNFAINFAATKVEVSKASDLAYSQGAYSLTLTDPKTKKAVTEKGKYVTAFKKQADGTWKAVADMLNGDGPPEPAK
ncbi:MAG: SgcJ/EcaC family oxidoreductase [Candidatus Solibacter usitatus]|nr:SgcJ/EcaC family oxidoreductase [Candidatus Solibacter usitatus]